MSIIKKKLKPNNQPHPNLKLPPGTVLLALPKDPNKDYHCVRCEAEWKSRLTGALPVRCPRCASPAWNKNRVNATILPAGVK